VTIYGDGRQVRDVLDVSNAVEAYVEALARIDHVHGRAFNLGGGPGNAISLLQLIDHISAVTGESVDVEFEDWRQGDQRWYVSDTHAARSALGLRKPVGWRDGVLRLAEWLATDRDAPLRTEPRFASAAE
jgi:CDP-paratose 2-epimerase